MTGRIPEVRRACSRSQQNWRTYIGVASSSGQDQPMPIISSKSKISPGTGAFPDQVPSYSDSAMVITSK